MDLCWNGAEINGWYPNLISSETVPENTGNQVRVDEEQGDPKDDLEHGFSGNCDVKLSDLLQDLSDTIDFQHREEILDNFKATLDWNSHNESDPANNIEGGEEIDEEITLKDVLLRYTLQREDLISRPGIDVTGEETHDDINDEDDLNRGHNDGKLTVLNIVDHKTESDLQGSENTVVYSGKDYNDVPNLFNLRVASENVPLWRESLVLISVSFVNSWLEIAYLFILLIPIIIVVVVLKNNALSFLFSDVRWILKEAHIVRCTDSRASSLLGGHRKLWFQILVDFSYVFTIFFSFCFIVVVVWLHGETELARVFKMSIDFPLGWQVLRIFGSLRLNSTESYALFHIIFTDLKVF